MRGRTVFLGLVAAVLAASAVASRGGFPGSLFAGAIRRAALRRGITLDGVQVDVLARRVSVDAVRLAPRVHGRPLTVSAVHCGAARAHWWRVLRRQSPVADVLHCERVTALAGTWRLDARDLRANLADSVAGLGPLTLAPLAAESAAAARSPYRHDYTTLAIARIAAKGFVADSLVGAAVLRARRVDVDSAVLEDFLDARKPPAPHPPRRLTPQQFAAALPVGLSLDAVIVRRARAVYRQLSAGHDTAGVVPFTHITAVFSGVTHRRGARGDPAAATRVDVQATVMGAGRLAAHFDIPLDAPGMAMAYRGRLGPMPADAWNGIVAGATAVKVAGGQLDSVTFDANVAYGVARGRLLAAYHGLSVTVTGRGSHGLTSRRSIFGGAARRLATLAANRFEVRGANPLHRADAPAVEPITLGFDGSQALPTWLWWTLRGPLLRSIGR